MQDIYLLDDNTCGGGGTWRKPMTLSFRWQCRSDFYKGGKEGRQIGRISDCRTIWRSFRASWWEVFQPKLPIKGAPPLTGSSRQYYPYCLQSLAESSRWEASSQGEHWGASSRGWAMLSVPIPTARDLKLTFTWPYLASEVMHLLLHGILYKQAVSLPRFPEET